MKRTSLVFSVTIVALLLVMAGLAPAGPDAALTGTYWRAVTIDGGPVASQPKPREAHLVFTVGHRVSGSAGCNRISGTFTQTADGLCFSQMISTKMACPPPLDAQERAFLAALNATAALQIAGNTLELKDATGKVRLRFEAGER